MQGGDENSFFYKMKNNALLFNSKARKPKNPRKGEVPWQ
jgi:hypothetical protein